MSKVERLYHLHNILSQRRTPISRQDLMERLECSQATFYRLVAELRDYLGAPLEQDEETAVFTTIAATTSHSNYRVSGSARQNCRHS